MFAARLRKRPGDGAYLNSMLAARKFPTWDTRDFTIGDYGLPTVGTGAVGTGTSQSVLTWATVVALGRYVVEQIHEVDNRLTTRSVKGKKKTELSFK